MAKNQTLTKAERKKVQKLMRETNRSMKDCIALVLRRKARMQQRPEHLGSAKRAQGYYII